MAEFNVVHEVSPSNAYAVAVIAQLPFSLRRQAYARMQSLLDEDGQRLVEAILDTPDDDADSAAQAAPNQHVDEDPLAIME